MNNMEGVLLETETACRSRAPGFTSGFWWGQCCSSFIVFCAVFFCFVRVRACFPYVASFSGLSILDSFIGFLSLKSLFLNIP